MQKLKIGKLKYKRSIAIIFLLIVFAFYKLKSTSEKNIKNLLLRIDSIENQYKNNIPIYTDYITPNIENQLRKYLLNYHIQVAIENNNKAVQNKTDLEARIKEKSLVSINTDDLNNYLYFYNVPLAHRYLTQDTKKILILLGERFQKILKEKEVIPNVKFAISSALRHADYQNNLKKTNTNAAFISSHSYGRSFDVFYDEYFVSLNDLDNEIKFNVFHKSEMQLKRKFGFLLGQSLRRQFQSILTEAVVQLQNEGKIYSILEKSQRCYHITAR